MIHPPSPDSAGRSRLLHGPIAMMAANLFFGATPVFVRMCNDLGAPSLETTFVRFAFSCVAIAAILGLRRGTFATKNWPALVWRGIFGALAVLLYFRSVSLTSAGEGTLLNYTHSIWANLYLVLFFRQKAPRGFWPLLGLAALGLWLVLDPRFGSLGWGEALGLVSGMMGGGAVLSTKKLRQTDNALTIFTSFSVVGLIFSAAAAPFARGAESVGAWRGHGGELWAALLAMSAIAMAGQLLFTHGYGYTSVALGTVMSLSVPALSAVGGWLLLGERLTPHFLLGGGLILLACGALGFQERRTFLGFEHGGWGGLPDPPERHS